MPVNKKPTVKSIAGERKHMGKVDRTVMFPVAPKKSEISSDYPELLLELKRHISQQRLRIILTSNVAMVLLYWDIGQRDLS